MSKKSLVDQLPKTVRVGPFNYTFVPMKPIEGETRGLYGEHSAMEQCIYIRTDLNPDRMVAIVMHELTHAIAQSYSMFVSEKDTATEELIACVMGNAWTQVWRDNPGLLKWIQKALHG